MSERNLTLLTDLYELTMMQGYFKEKDANETVIFDAFYRNNPVNSGYSICAGLEQVIDYVKNLHFDESDIDYLRSVGLFEEDFLEYLRGFHFPAIFTQFRKAPSSSRVSLSSRSLHRSWRPSLLRPLS